MNHYLWLSVPREINEAPVEEQERILEAARKRAGVFLPAYWTAMAHGLGIGLGLGVIVAIMTFGIDVRSTPLWGFYLPAWVGLFIGGGVVRLLNRRFMRRSVREVLVEEGDPPTVR